jgi:hypothetical protein
MDRRHQNQARMALCEVQLRIYKGTKMNTEDDEFNRIEREAKWRQHEPSSIPLITDEEWEALNKEDDAIPPQPNT